MGSHWLGLSQSGEDTAHTATTALLLEFYHTLCYKQEAHNKAHLTLEEHDASSQMTEILENICVTATLSTFTPSLCLSCAWWHSLSFHTLACFSPERPACASAQGRPAPGMNQLLPTSTASALQEMKAALWLPQSTAVLWTVV